MVQEEDSRREEFRTEGALIEEEIRILEMIGDIRNIKNNNIKLNGD